jgi:hypothetical protein
MQPTHTPKGCLPVTRTSTVAAVARESSCAFFPSGTTGPPPCLLASGGSVACSRELLTGPLVTRPAVSVPPPLPLNGKDGEDLVCATRSCILPKLVFESVDRTPPALWTPPWVLEPLAFKSSARTARQQAATSTY